jgi:hypothetical protein
MVTRCWASAPCTEAGEPMVNSPAGITTIRGQPPQSSNSVTAPGTLQMTGGAARRCCGDSASSRACAAATSAAVSALSSANRLFNSGWAGAMELPCAWAATASMAPASIPPTQATDETRRQFMSWAGKARMTCEKRFIAAPLTKTCSLAFWTKRSRWQRRAVRPRRARPGGRGISGDAMTTPLEEPDGGSGRGAVAAAGSPFVLRLAR